MKLGWLRPILIGTTALPVVLTALSFSRRPHWIFRMWDFPRVQIATLAGASAIAYGVAFYRGEKYEIALLVLAGAVVGWQVYRIHTYTPLVRPTVKRVPRDKASADDRIVVLMTNVQMENEHHEQLVERVTSADPDVVLAVEIDEKWMRGIAPLLERYPHSIRQPQDNWYGMVLLSKLELVEPKVEFLVQDDIPSIHTRVRLRSGVEVTVRGLHPRPPEPIRDQPSSPRDAELVIVGKQIGDRKTKEPTIVAGDLNDVAWSSTSELFVRLSGLLDPRVGRGFYNSYNAKNLLFRFPLDHVFHSTHFELVRLERLRAIGSDHFPILIELQYVPEAPGEQEESREKPNDRAIANEKLEQEAHDAATGADRPNE